MNKYIKLGRAVANKSTHNFRHATLLLRGGKVLSYGYNHDNRHAEYNAIKSVWPKFRRGAVLINFRIGRKDTLLNSRPCFECEQFSRQAGIKKIIFSTGEGFKEIKL